MRKEKLRVAISMDEVMREHLIVSARERGCTVTSFVTTLLRKHYSNLQDMSDKKFLKEYVNSNVQRCVEMNIRFYDTHLVECILAEAKRKNISKSFALYLIILNYYANEC